MGDGGGRDTWKLECLEAERRWNGRQDFTGSHHSLGPGYALSCTIVSSTVAYSKAVRVALGAALVALGAGLAELAPWLVGLRRLKVHKLLR